MLQTIREEVDKTERHLEVLELVAEREPVGIVKLSDVAGYPHHKVRYSLRLLEDEGLIVPTANGAATTDDLSEFLRKVDADLQNLEGRIEALRTTEVPTSDGGE